MRLRLVLFLSVALTLGAAPPAAATQAPAAPSLRVLAITPGGGTIPGDAAFTVRFSAPLGASARPLPALRPGLAGTWSQPSPATLRFTPKSAYLPGSSVELVVPAGIKAADGTVLTRAVTHTYRVGQPAPARLTQLLADLRFLPVHFVSSRDPRAGDLSGQLRALYSPPPGRYVFGRGWPAHLHWLWALDTALVLRGALMSFETQRGLPMDGVAGPQVWNALLQARLHWRINRSGYTYAMASESSPESLTVYHNGGIALRTPANTGIPGSGTAQGTFPVFERLRSQVMKGTNPDGSHYADFVQWVAYFNGGDAVHYMPRADYGTPQSLGCIELPYTAAARAWGYLSYGTLVTVGG